MGRFAYDDIQQMDFLERALWHQEFIDIQLECWSIDPQQDPDYYEYLCELIATEYIGG